MAGRKVLADWLKGKYELTNRDEVVSKEKLFHVIRGERKEVPDSGIWFQVFPKKDNPDLIVSVVPTLLHAYCLQLAEDYDDIVKLKTITRTYHRWPWDSNGTMHGYMTVTNADGVMADGEVHLKTVQPSMIPYICTIMNKRAEDRLILKALGLYQQGFYSQEEFSTDVENVTTYSKNSISPEEIERNKRVILMGELKEIFDAIKEFNSNFKPEDYTKNVLSVTEISNLTLNDWETVKKGATSLLHGFKNPGEDV